MLLAAKIFLTIATLGYSAIPYAFDFDKTHVKNPDWDAHARFHVVWQVSSYIYMAALALYLIWTAGTDTWPLWLAFILGAAGYGGFWTAVFTRSTYNTNLLSRVNPVPDFKWNMGGKQVRTDANVTLFTVFVVVLLAGAICIKLA
ncbi:MAG: hypothetical protein KGO94_12450 [Alphaproteobacteria bacterium]|nr:hypothetical protein [Alphaproteobacteria bacterium]